LTRTRTQLTRERARHVQRIHKTLEDANIKLSSAITDVLGVTGRAILEALIRGETDPEGLVDLRRGRRLKATDEQLLEALRGGVREHHRFLLKLHLDQVDAVEAAVERVEARVGELIEPFREKVELLKTIPGVSETTARVIVAEIGLEMDRFPASGHLVSWAGLCPGNDESAGKRHSTKLRSGAVWLKSALVQAAWPASKKRDSYLRSQYLRLRARRGPKKAVVAVAASMLTAAYFMLQRNVAYADLGSSFLDQRDREKTAKRLVRRLQGLGFTVEVKAA
jgi:transposase